MGEVTHSVTDHQKKLTGGIEIDEIDETGLEDGSSLCESESAASITNQNYCGPMYITGKGKGAKGSKKKEGAEEVVVIFCDSNYLFSCGGFVRLLLATLSLVALVSLSICRTIDDKDFLQLPLDWHLRIMVFVAVAALLYSLLFWVIHVTALALMLPVNWFFIDMVVYSVLSFLFLISSSLIASAFDFYQKVDLLVPIITIHKMIVCTVVGYVCMVLHGLIAYVSYRRWQIQHNLFKRRKLLEEEDDYLDI